MNRKEVIEYALTLKDTLEDYPFSDSKYGNCPVFKHKNTGKWFGIIMQVAGEEYLNVKTPPDYSDLLRNSFDYIIPAYHMNKEHWNTIIISKKVDENLVKGLIEQSYNLTKK